MLMCSFGGFLHVHYFSTERPLKSTGQTNAFSYIIKNRNLLAVGSLRYTTLFLGLIALWYVEVSFAETGKFCLDCCLKIIH